MRVKDGERVISKLFTIIELFLINNSVTSDDIVKHTGMSKRSAQRYLKDAMDNMDIKKNDDGSYSLLNKSNMYSIVKRDDSYLTTTLLQYARALFPETRYDAIDKYITDKIDVENLFILTNDNNGEIKSIDFNTSLINKYLTNATKSIQKNLKYVEEGNIKKVEYKADLLDSYDEKSLKNGVIYYLNSGFIFNNPIFANFGAQIPIKISLTGDVISNISTEITNYGINNALIKVYANIKITENIILPFYDKEIEVESKVPVALKLISGTVPSYYGNLNTTTPSLTLPSD